MALLDIRQRAGYLFLARHARARHPDLGAGELAARGVPVLEAVTFGVFAEVQRGVVGRRLGVARRAGAATSACAASRAENDALQAAAGRGAGRSCRSSGRWPTAARGLERLLELREQPTLKTTAAEIIGAGATPDFRTRDDRQGHARRPAAGHGGDRAGRRRRPRRRAERARRRRCSCSSIATPRPARSIERSRAQGVVVGGGDERLRMEYVSEVADVVVGDVVVTSGIDGIFPKGFVIGRVEAVEKSGGAYKRDRGQAGGRFLERSRKCSSC